MIKVTEGKMVVLKAVLYFCVAFLTPLSMLMQSFADYEPPVYPPLPKIVACILAGTLAGLVALRAYFDGSNARWEDRQNGSFKVEPEKEATP